MLSNGVKTSYTYDSRNRLVQAGNIHYEYDAEDVRTAVITPDYREDYTVDREATFSQVLSVSRTYVAGTKEETTYYYGSGLVYEKKTGTLSDDSQSNEDTTLQVYHFNHLGSTICLTDKTGTVTNRFNYGTYGELLTADKAVVVDITRFLYNGEYGVQTDANGLYYMRSRYYSPEIRRFINQDVITGSINQSASLNRYSYVEGNPVSYTDPFGLSPYQFISRTIHIGLDVVGIFVPGANVVNALYYFAEGNIYDGVESLIFSLAGGALGKGFKYAAAGGKTFTISAETIAAITQGSRGLAAGLAANDVGQGIAGMIEDYGIDGKDISGRTILEVLGILASGAQMVAYGNAFANGFAGAAGVLGSEGKSETSYGKSREIIQCNTKDAAADELAKRIGGQSRSAFADDPIQREFDVISDQYIAQAKPPLKCVNKTVRTQMKATFEAAKKYERKVYYQFEGIPSQEVLDKLYEYSERYGVEVIIDTEPLGILN